ncbi:MAG: patatin-like phospholipase family protein [Candidatus Saganbacteria bacterium]|nr:patatin-like phospholipase family protein [Candidatus Saganbacteria bacterium]
MNKLALVLSGGFVKGAAHISIAEEMYKRGYKPDIFVGTSIGAIFSVLLGLYDDPKTVKEISLKFVKKHIWPQLLSFDLFSKAGLIDSKETVKLIAKEAGLTGKTFNDLKKPVYITATDLNSGKQIVFSPSTPRYCSSLGTSKESNMLISEALEASISFPVIFKPKKVKVGNKVMALADGGIRENCPISVAARIAGVKRIIACDLGYCGQVKGDFNKKNIMDVFMQCLDLTTSFSQINRYINDDIFLKKKIAVRIINPGIFDVHPFDFKEIPAIMDRAAKTAGFIFSRFKRPDDFFRYWQRDPFDREYMTMEHIGKKAVNAFQIVDFS